MVLRAVRMDYSLLPTEQRFITLNNSYLICLVKKTEKLTAF